MEITDYDYCKRKHVPAFGSWNWNHDQHFTQCFESARQARFLQYGYSIQDHDLYVAGDLYENHVVTPAMIIVPCQRARAHEASENEAKKVVNCGAGDVKEPPSRVSFTPKRVDEDLYKISPELLYNKPGKKRRLGLLSSCFAPTCVL